MSENTKKTKTIAFRVSEIEFAQIEKTAQASGKNPNDWCRDLAIVEASLENSLSPNERIIFEELAKARYLLGIGFGLLASGDLSTESWNQTKKLVDEKSSEIAAALLKRRK
jgi:uncharacterized protein (DUF1778 family)